MKTPTDSSLPPARPLANAASGTGVELGVDGATTMQRQVALRAARARHWQRTRRLTALLLALWLASSFCSVFFARELAHWSVFGWPLSFYLAAQGAALVYLAIIGIYALCMRRLDQRFEHELGAAGTP